jgi:hypothetical protein
MRSSSCGVVACLHLGVRREAGHAVDDAQFLLLARVADHELHHEAVDLRLGQRVGALLLDRVLRRQHQERVRQPPRVAGQRHLPFLHRLEQRRLHLRRRAVDLVGEHEVGEHRAFLDLPLARLRVVDVRADEVGRQQVGRELDAPELPADRTRQRGHGERLGEARQALEQHVAVGEQGDQQAVEQGILADDDRSAGRAHGLQGLALGLGCVGRWRRRRSCGGVPGAKRRTTIPRAKTPQSRAALRAAKRSRTTTKRSAGSATGEVASRGQASAPASPRALATAARAGSSPNTHSAASSGPSRTRCAA